MLDAGSSGPSWSMAEFKLTRSEEGFLLGLRVSPSAKRTRFQGRYGDRLKLQVAAPPENDQANQEVLRTLAEWLGLPRDYVALRAGHKTKDKTLLIRGLPEGELRRRLDTLAE